MIYEEIRKQTLASGSQTSDCRHHLIFAPQLQENGGDARNEHINEDEGSRQNEEDVIDGGILILGIYVVPHVVLP